MNSVVVMSYASALILLYICILLYSLACRYGNDPYRKLLVALGLLPGLAGVVYGCYLFLSLEDRALGLAVMSAWGLLEMGALHIKLLMRG